MMVFEDVEVEMEVFYWVELQIFGKGKCNVPPFEKQSSFKELLDPFFLCQFGCIHTNKQKEKSFYMVQAMKLLNI